MAIRYSENFAARHSGEQTTADVPKSTRWHYAHGLGQQASLPKEVPELEGWQINPYYQPAREVGGDFYDFFELRDGRLGLVVGDATGKSVPAALVMASARSMLSQPLAITTRYQAGSVTRPSVPVNGPSASRAACVTANSPECPIASAVGPAPTKACTAPPASSKTIRVSISSSSSTVKPAAASTSSSFPGSDKANMPPRFMRSNASGGKRGNSGLNTKAIPDSETRLEITTATGPRETRRASVRARTLSSANWKALNPVTASKESSGHDNASR